VDSSFGVDEMVTAGVISAIEDVVVVASDEDLGVDCSVTLV